MTDEIFIDPLGRKYLVLSGAEFNTMFEGISRRTHDEDERILIPTSAPVNKLEFPSNPLFNDFHLAVSSGTVLHNVERQEAYGPELPRKIAKTSEGLRVEGNKGFTATALQVFVEIDWHGECWGVMEAHGWHGPKRRISQLIIDNVSKEIGPCEITKAKLEFGENWEIRVAELATIQLVRPLSRLWYAVNMMALYYCHHDDLRLGFLWAEYQMRMRAEKNALRGEVMLKSASDGGLARRATTSAKSGCIIAAMGKRIFSGLSVANAARLTFNQGLGASPDANRKLWARHNRK